MKAGAVYKYDLSLPVDKMYNLVEEMRSRLGNQSFFLEFKQNLILIADPVFRFTSFNFVVLYFAI